VSLCERCAERKNGNYHAWNHRQWVLQKAPDLLCYEINKTEKFIRKNVADYSAYHHRHFVLMKLFDLQYFDIHDTNQNDELYQFVNSRLVPSDGRKINNNVNDLVLNLLPNLPIAASQINRTKLNSFLYLLNLIIHDLKMLKELTELYGKYEAFNCYRRIIIKLAIDACRLCYNTDYLTNEHFVSKSSPTIINNAQQQPLEIVDILVQQLDMNEENNVKFAKLFY
jgi:protein prenyltransferase alpha subunit repeat containing protein 1